MSFSIDETAQVPAWQARALERSLADARARSVERLSLLVDAARYLATATGSSDFTVQQVVERAGVSLKSFYRYFRSKDDLLIALIEEDSRIGAAILGDFVESHVEPEDRLHAYLEGLFTFLAVGDRGYVAVLAAEHRRLRKADPKAMRQALAPFIELLGDELADAAAAGIVRPGDFARDARMVFDLVLSMIDQVVLEDDDLAPKDAEAYVWDFCWSGLRRGGS